MHATVPVTEIAAGPDSLGHIGPYGGRFVPETLVPALDELAAAYTLVSFGAPATPGVETPVHLHAPESGERQPGERIESDHGGNEPVPPYHATGVRQQEKCCVNSAEC